MSCEEEECECFYTHVLDSSKTGRTFLTENEAFLWATDACNEMRFNIIWSSRKKQRFDSKRGMLYHHYFTCDKAGRKENMNKVVLRDLNRKRVTGSKRVDCDFRGVIRLHGDGMFHITVFEGCHNHPLTYYVEGNLSYTRLTEADKRLIGEMSRAHCKAKVIVEALQTAEPTKSYVRKAIYNHVHREKKSAAEGRNPARQFLKIAHERNYFTRFSVLPGSTNLKDMFWCHPTAMKMLRRWPNVFCIDATYSTNKYNYALVEIVGVTPTNQNFIAGQALLQREDKSSYQWALECLGEMLGKGKNPIAIITDRELGLFEPIEKVFPKSHHVLCMFHVKKMIRSKALNILKNETEADGLCYGAVKNVLEAPSVEEFEENLEVLRARYHWFPGFLGYLDEIWLPHKEKLVFAWTNNVMHYGNNTTNRVESAHSALKGWMKSAKGGLDTLFEEVDAEVRGQVTEIKCKLEWSRSKNLLGFDCVPYMSLLCRVSHHCLMLLKAEKTKTGRCTHAIATTHGLPCRCFLESLTGKGSSVFPDRIDRFWSTLVFDGEEIDNVVCPYDIGRIARDFALMDPAKQERLGNMFHAEMYPSECPYEEPVVNVVKRGRHKKEKTNRQLSHWEHIEKKFANKPTTIEADEKKTINGIKDVPPYLRQYVECIHNVDPDGNCGFRVAALKFLGKESCYGTVRQLLVTEISRYSEEYKNIYNRDGEVEQAINRIDWKGTGRARRRHWMQTHCDLFPLAQVFRAAVTFYSCDDKKKEMECSTVLPWRGDIGEFKELPEISIILRRHSEHFVLGHFMPDSPMPTLHPLWRTICSRSLLGLEVRYASRLTRYAELQEVYLDYRDSCIPKSKRKPRFYQLSEDSESE